MKKQLYVLLLLVLGSAVAKAQTDSIEINSSEKPKKKYTLTFRLDNSLSDLKFNNSLSYEGEYFQNNTQEYIWKSYDSTLINYNEISRHINLKFDLMISIIEPLSIGLSYHLINIQTQKTTSTGANGTLTRNEFYPFFALAGIVDYKIGVKPVKRLYLNPSITLGTYQGFDLFTGVGKEWYADVKLAVLYNLGKKERLGLRLYADYSNWLYREKRTSKPFPERSRIVKGNMSSINYGLGLTYRFALIPD